MTSPSDFQRRSFLARKLVEAGANFVPLFDAAVASDFGDLNGESDAAQRLALADLSPLPRWGLKGPGGPDWLAAQGATVPVEPNRAALQSGGELVARLSAGEVLVLGNPASDTSGLPQTLAEAWQSESLPPETPRGFPLPRQESYAWVMITGAHAPEMFAKICAVDLRLSKFPDLSIAQTSVARTTAIVVRRDLGDTPGYHVVFDCASAEYMWLCLTDAMEEFDGRVVGLATIRKLLI